MKMKDFKAALERKMRYAEKYLKEDSDYYLGYYSCMEDMMHFINDDLMHFIDDKSNAQEIDNI